MSGVDEDGDQHNFDLWNLLIIIITCTYTGGVVHAIIEPYYLTSCPRRAHSIMYDVHNVPELPLDS